MARTKNTARRTLHPNRRTETSSTGTSTGKSSLKRKQKEGGAKKRKQASVSSKKRKGATPASSDQHLYTEEEMRQALLNDAEEKDHSTTQKETPVQLPHEKN